MKKYFIYCCMLVCNLSYSDWRYGKIDMIAIAYDGATISIHQEGFNRTDCTCYAPWPARYCLDTARDTFEMEYSLLLTAKVREKSVAINIDEITCRVTAMYEN